MKEQIRVEEKLNIVIRDSATKKVIKRMTIAPKIPAWKKILSKITGKECHATVSDKGKDMAATLFGGVSGGYPVNCMDVYRGTWDTAQRKTGTQISLSTISVGTLRVNNEASPWTIAGTYNTIRCSNTIWPMGDATNYHNQIAITVTIASGQEWWAEVEFAFS
jgi:hypothetical protein